MSDVPNDSDMPHPPAMKVGGRRFKAPTKTVADSLQTEEGKVSKEAAVPQTSVSKELQQKDVAGELLNLQRPPYVKPEEEARKTGINYHPPQPKTQEPHFPPPRQVQFSRLE